MAAVGWIDLSREHRDKVRTMIEMLKKQGVVDQSGVGIIRDSDRHFHGVSTIHTRAGRECHEKAAFPLFHVCQQLFSVDT